MIEDLTVMLLHAFVLFGVLRGISWMVFGEGPYDPDFPEHLTIIGAAAAAVIAFVNREVAIVSCAVLGFLSIILMSPVHWSSRQKEEAVAAPSGLRWLYCGWLVVALPFAFIKTSQAVLGVAEWRWLSVGAVIGAVNLVLFVVVLPFYGRRALARQKGCSA